MSEPKITFLGHTSILVETGGIQFIFDPNFSKQVGINNYLPLLHLKRGDQAFIDTEILHKTQVIFFSNAHHNRFDPPSLRYFKQTSQIILPLGLGKMISNFYKFKLSELKAGAQTSVGDCEIYALKSLHRGFRKLPLFYNHSLNYILKSPDMTLFYCSDTSYQGAYFYEIGKKFKIDVAILPIDHVGPNFLAKNRFMTSTQALQAFRDLEAKKMIANGFGSFHFSKKDQLGFLDAFKAEIEKQGLEGKVEILSPGESVYIPRPASKLNLVAVN